MAQRSQTGKDDGVDALLNAEIPRLSKCLRAEELTEVSEQHDGDGRKQALEKAAAVYEENAVLRDENASLKLQRDDDLNEIKSLKLQRDDDRNEIKLLKLQHNDDLNETKSLKLQRDDFKFKVGMRQVLTFFRKKHGRAIDVHVMASVIDLATQRIKLTNYLDGQLSSYDRAKFERQMTAVTRKLDSLKTVAKGFETSEMTSIGEGVFAMFFLVAEVNKACHRDLTEEFLDAMLGHAERGACVSGGFDFGDAASVEIEKLRTPFRHHAAQT